MSVWRMAMGMCMVDMGVFVCMIVSMIAIVTVVVAVCVGMLVTALMLFS
jgi:hypothetical protein